MKRIILFHQQLRAKLQQLRAKLTPEVRKKIYIGLAILAVISAPAVYQFGTSIVAMLMFSAYCQNITFSMVSRARNRNNAKYHMVASVGSNCVWFMTMSMLVEYKLTWWLMLPYTYATVLGSLTGAQISQQIECWLGATSDSHIKAPAK